MLEERPAEAPRPVTTVTASSDPLAPGVQSMAASSPLSAHWTVMLLALEMVLVRSGEWFCTVGEGSGRPSLHTQNNFSDRKRRCRN